MARSTLSFDDDPQEAEGAQEAAARSPKRRKPLALGGAVSQKYIKPATEGGAARSYQDVPVAQIAASAIQDRIDPTHDLDSLIESIRDNGQQVPVIIRYRDGPLPYEIVVGRRRLAAVKALSQSTVKAFVTRMDDREAFIAQGIENHERLETSFIERARAASQAHKAGFDQNDIAEFLNVSQASVSYLTKTYADVGEDIVLAIGPARGIGRRKWDALAQLIKKKRLTKAAVIDLIQSDIEDSSERFEALARALATDAGVGTGKQGAAKRSLLGGQISEVRKPNEISFKLGKGADPALLDRIQKSIEHILTEETS